MIVIEHAERGRNLRYHAAVELTITTGPVWHHGGREAHSFQECIDLGWVIEDTDR